MPHFETTLTEVTFFCIFKIVEKPTPAKKQRLMPMSKNVADSVGKLVKAAENLKGILGGGQGPYGQFFLLHFRNLKGFYVGGGVSISIDLFGRQLN